ncbi:MAG: D-alanyl-D-alanine carboxypeptidase family protein [Nitrospiraceae bacterium]
MSRWSGLLGMLLAFTPMFIMVAHAESTDVVSTSSRSVRLAGMFKPTSLFPWRRIPAHSILLKDLKTGQTLYEFESGKRLSPASLTKIMSALVILEYGRLEDDAIVSKHASHAHKTHLRLRVGQVFRLEDLLKAMLIVSANDACLAAVEHVGGDEGKFVALMNAKAASLGLSDTHFSNACGFDAPDHYSTAEDLAKLSETAMRDPVFKRFVGVEREIITPVNGQRGYLLRNTNRLLGRIPGVEGVKTGFTSKAGRCLVAKVSQNGRDLLVVILNSKRRWNTAQSLINYGLRLGEG